MGRLCISPALSCVTHSPSLDFRLVDFPCILEQAASSQDPSSVFCLPGTLLAQVLSFFFFLRLQFYFILAPQHVGSQFPNQGSNSHGLHWRHGVLTTGLPGNALSIFLSSLNISFSEKTCWSSSLHLSGRSLSLNLYFSSTHFLQSIIMFLYLLNFISLVVHGIPDASHDAWHIINFIFIEWLNTWLNTKYFHVIFTYSSKIVRHGGKWDSHWRVRMNSIS